MTEGQKGSLKKGKDRRGCGAARREGAERPWLRPNSTGEVGAVGCRAPAHLPPLLSPGQSGSTPSKVGWAHQVAPAECRCLLPLAHWPRSHVRSVRCRGGGRPHPPQSPLRRLELLPGALLLCSCRRSVWRRVHKVSSAWLQAGLYAWSSEGP